MPSISDIGTAADCEECYNCNDASEIVAETIGLIITDTDMIHDIFYETKLMEMVYSAIGEDMFPIYPWFDEEINGWDGSPSSVCACIYTPTDEDLAGPGSADVGVAYAFNVTNSDTCLGIISEEAEAPTDIISGQWIFNDIELIDSATGFLTPSWNLIGISDITLAENLGTGKVGIYYDVEEVEYSSDTWFGLFAVNVNLYHTIYSHADPIFNEAGLVGTTFVTQVILADVENEGLQVKFGGDEVDIEGALTSDINDLIALIAATIVESQYTFKKIKQPTVDVRLFSAFEEGQKEETQTLSVTTTSTKTTY